VNTKTYGPVCNCDWCVICSLPASDDECDHSDDVRIAAADQAETVEVKRAFAARVVTPVPGDSCIAPIDLTGSPDRMSVPVRIVTPYPMRRSAGRFLDFDSVAPVRAPDTWRFEPAASRCCPYGCSGQCELDSHDDLGILADISFCEGEEPESPTY